MLQNDNPYVPSIPQPDRVPQGIQMLQNDNPYVPSIPQPDRVPQGIQTQILLAKTSENHKSHYDVTKDICFKGD